MVLQIFNTFHRIRKREYLEIGVQLFRNLDPRKGALVENRKLSKNRNLLEIRHEPNSLAKVHISPTQNPVSSVHCRPISKPRRVEFLRRIRRHPFPLPQPLVILPFWSNPRFCPLQLLKPQSLYRLHPPCHQSVLGQLEFKMILGTLIQSRILLLEPSYPHPLLQLP